MFITLLAYGNSNTNPKSAAIKNTLACDQTLVTRVEELVHRDLDSGQIDFLLSIYEALSNFLLETMRLERWRAQQLSYRSNSLKNTKNTKAGSRYSRALVLVGNNNKPSQQPRALPSTHHRLVKRGLILTRGAN